MFLKMFLPNNCKMRLRVLLLLAEIRSRCRILEGPFFSLLVSMFWVYDSARQAKPKAQHNSSLTTIWKRATFTNILTHLKKVKQLVLSKSQPYNQLICLISVKLKSVATSNRTAALVMFGHNSRSTWQPPSPLIFFSNRHLVIEAFLFYWVRSVTLPIVTRHFSKTQETRETCHSNSCLIENGWQKG